MDVDLINMEGGVKNMDAAGHKMAENFEVGV